MHLSFLRGAFPISMFEDPSSVLCLWDHASCGVPAHPHTHLERVCHPTHEPGSQVPPSVIHLLSKSNAEVESWGMAGRAQSLTRHGEESRQDELSPSGGVRDISALESSAFSARQLDELRRSDRLIFPLFV